jgi:membrane protein implicated in regulation of membrane protease activity
MMRFTILSVLTIQFGPHIVDVFNNIIFRHWQISLVVAAVVVLIIVLLVRRRRTQVEPPVHVNETGARD